MLPALAFVPEEDVVEAFEQVQEHFPEEAEDICDYFEDNFIGRVRGLGQNRRRQSLRFLIGLWNIVTEACYAVLSVSK